MKIRIYNGDITEAETEAIVNAANNHLWMGSGVAGAIKKKGGQIIEEEAVAQGPIEIGGAVATTAGDLPHEIVIHAAGMGPDLKTSEDLVYKSTMSSLLLAEEHKIKSIGFPAIGTGVGGLSIADCARAMKKAVEVFTPLANTVAEIHFVIFGNKASADFKAGFEK